MRPNRDLPVDPGVPPLGCGGSACGEVTGCGASTTFCWTCGMVGVCLGDCGTWSDLSGVGAGLGA